jgi:hypothetical protein
MSVHQKLNRLHHKLGASPLINFILGGLSLLITGRAPISLATGCSLARAAARGSGRTNPTISSLKTLLLGQQKEELQARRQYPEETTSILQDIKKLEGKTKDTSLIQRLKQGALEVKSAVKT